MGRINVRLQSNKDLHCLTGRCAALSTFPSEQQLARGPQANIVTHCCRGVTLLARSFAAERLPSFAWRAPNAALMAAARLRGNKDKQQARNA